MVQTHNTTLEEYLRFIALPENDDRRFEYVEGEITEVVSNNYCSMVAARIAGEMFVYIKGTDLGYILGADGGFQVGEDRYIPDVSFISKRQQPTPLMTPSTLIRPIWPSKCSPPPIGQEQSEPRSTTTQPPGRSFGWLIQRRKRLRSIPPARRSSRCT